MRWALAHHEPNARPAHSTRRSPASHPSPHGRGDGGEGQGGEPRWNLACFRFERPLTPAPEPRFARARGAGSCHRQLPNSPAPSAGRGEQQPGSTGETRTTRSTAHPQRSKNTQGLIPSPAQAKDRPAAKGAPLRACPACLAGQVQATGAGRTGGGQCSRYHCPTRGRPEARTSRTDVRSGR